MKLWSLVSAYIDQFYLLSFFSLPSQCFSHTAGLVDIQDPGYRPKEIKHKKTNEKLAFTEDHV